MVGRHDRSGKRTREQDQDRAQQQRTLEEGLTPQHSVQRFAPTPLAASVASRKVHFRLDPTPHARQRSEDCFRSTLLQQRANRDQGDAWQFRRA